MWVTPPARTLECSVCSVVFADPVTLACGHTLCRACAVKCFEATKCCPLCRHRLDADPAALPTNYSLKSMVEELRVYCRFGLREDDRGGWMPDPAGCPLQLSRGEAAAHEAACEYAQETCPFAGCGVQLRRRDAAAHNATAALTRAASATHASRSRPACAASAARVSRSRRARALSRRAWTLNKCAWTRWRLAWLLSDLPPLPSTRVWLLSGLLRLLSTRVWMRWKPARLLSCLLRVAVTPVRALSLAQRARRGASRLTLAGRLHAVGAHTAGCWSPVAVTKW